MKRQKYPVRFKFKDNIGHSFSLDSRLTIADLTALGIHLHLEPRNKPRKKGVLYHDPKESNL